MRALWQHPGHAGGVHGMDGVRRCAVDARIDVRGGGVRLLADIGYLLVPEAHARAEPAIARARLIGAACWRRARDSSAVPSGAPDADPAARLASGVALRAIGAGTAITALNLTLVFLAGARRSSNAGRFAALLSIAGLAGQALALSQPRV